MISVVLKVVGGEMETQEIPLKLPAVVGRGRDVAVNLTHPLVSRRHCELVESNGQLMVRDLQSLNGTFIGSQRIEEGFLQPGDLLTVGTVTFRAVYEPVASAKVLELPGQHDRSKPGHGRTPPNDAARRGDQGTTKIGLLNDVVETVRFDHASRPAPHRLSEPVAESRSDVDLTHSQEPSDSSDLGGTARRECSTNRSGDSSPDSERGSDVMTPEIRAAVEGLLTSESQPDQPPAG